MRLGWSMARRPIEQPQSLVGLLPATKRPCDRCEEYEATRFGRAQVVGGERGHTWQDVGLCERCAAVCAGPSAIRSGLGGTHSIHRK